MLYLVTRAHTRSRRVEYNYNSSIFHFVCLLNFSFIAATAKGLNQFQNGTSLTNAILWVVKKIFCLHSLPIGSSLYNVDVLVVSKVMGIHVSVCCQKGLHNGQPVIQTCHPGCMLLI